VPDVAADLPAFRREEARHRCTVLLRCLCAVAVSTALIGLFPKLHVVWVFTGISGIAALALVGLMAYAKEIEAEQERRRDRQASRRAWSSDGEWHEAPPAVPGGPTWRADEAVAGYPGAWDDEDDDFEVPRAAAR
jgi:hypothetical protein